MSSTLNANLSPAPRLKRGKPPAAARRNFVCKTIQPPRSVLDYVTTQSMKLPRFLSTHPAALLAAVCAVLAFAPVAHAQIKVVPLTTDKVEKAAKFVQSVESDPAKKASMEEADKDEAVVNAMTTGGSINDVVNTKYPKAAAVYKAGGFTPDDFLALVVSISMASTGLSDGTSDVAVAKANVEFYNANKEKIDKVMESMTK